MTDEKLTATLAAEHGWIGVDLDGVLAEYHGWKGATHVGVPVPRMVERVKQWHSSGRNVRIMTARVAPGNGDAEECRAVIDAWMLANLGYTLPITHEKDHKMIELWDDRVVQVIPNTGITVEEQIASQAAEIERLREALRESAMCLREINAVVKDALRGGSEEAPASGSGSAAGA